VFRLSCTGFLFSSLPVILSVFSAAFADQPRRTSLDAQVRTADAIVHAKVLSGRSRFENGRVYTYYGISAVETLKGAPLSDAEIRIPGGVAGVVAYVVPGAPDFCSREEGVFFLKNYGRGIFELDGISSAVYRITADQQGLPYVESGTDPGEPSLSADGHLVPPGRPMPLADFKAAIRRCLGSASEQKQFALPPDFPASRHKSKARTSQPRLGAGNVQAGYSRILQKPVDIFWDLSRDYGPVADGKVSWYFNPDSIAGKSPYGVTPEQALEAVKWSFDQWNAVATARIEYSYAGSRTDIADHKLDLVNIITFADSEYIHGIQKDAIASARPFVLSRRTFVGPEGLDFDLDGRIDFPHFPEGIWEAGTIIDCDVRWDAGGPYADTDFAVDNTPGALSMQGVFNHELGHFAGLVHSPIRDLASLMSGGNRTPTMFSIAIPNPPDGSNNPMNSLEFDDMVSLSMLYPTPEFSSRFGTIEGTVVSGIDGSAVRGNFVAALSVPQGEPYRNLNDAYNRAEIAVGVFTDQQGEFRIRGLPPGEYLLALQPMDDVPTGTNKRAFNTLVARFGDTDFIWDEFYNGDAESAGENDPYAYEPVSVSAGGTAGGIRFVTNVYPKGRKSLRRLFGERDFYVAANQLRVPFSPYSSTQDLVARKLPQVFEAPYRVVSATCDFASFTAPPEGAQVIWPEIVLAVSDPDDPSRPDLENPVAMISDFAGDGTLLSTDPLPFEYPLTVDRPGELWLIVRSPDRRFNAFHNIDILGAGQDELQVDESFISFDGGATFQSVMDYGISWRMGVVLEGTAELEPLDEPRLVKSELIKSTGRIRLHFKAVKSLSGAKPESAPQIRLRHTYSARAYPLGSILRAVEKSESSGRFAFTLVRSAARADSAVFRVRDFGFDQSTDRLTGEMELVQGAASPIQGGSLSLLRRSGFGTGAFDGLWAGTLGSPSAVVFMDLRTAGGMPEGVFIWPEAETPPPDTTLVFISEPGDTIVEISALPANPVGFEVVALDGSGRRSNPGVLGLGEDYCEPNGRIKDARPVYPAYGFPQIRHSLNSIRGTIVATRNEDDLDYFRFPLRAGDSVVVDLDAVSARPFVPASSLDAYLEAFDSTGTRFTGTDGREVLNDDEHGLDPFVTFVSWRDATCYLRVLDALVAYGERGEMTGFNAFYELRISILPRKGDVVRDRVISIDDVLAALELVSSPQKINAETFFAADMNRDNKIDLNDVSRIFRRAISDPVALPPGGASMLASAGSSPETVTVNFRLLQRAPGRWDVEAGEFNSGLESFMLGFRVSGSVKVTPGEAENFRLKLFSRADGENLCVIGHFLQTEQQEVFTGGGLFELKARPEVRISLEEAMAGSGSGGLAATIETNPLTMRSLPRSFALEKNYPNPFNPSTTITYSVPSSAGAAFHQVALEVFDLRGRRVAVLASGAHEPGTYSVVWQGRDESGRPLPSGVYFSRLRSGSFSQTRKMVLVK